MDEITMSEVEDLVDPKLRAIARRVVLMAELAMEKAVAHDVEPNKFPLDADATIERIFLSRLRELRPIKKEVAQKLTMARVQAPSAVRQRRYKDLGKVNLSSKTSVDKQATELPFPASLKVDRAHLEGLKFHGQVIRPRFLTGEPQEGGLTPQQTTKKLEFRIHAVKCVDETDGFLGSESGDDEIDLAASTVDESGDVKKIAPFRVGSSFDDGEKVSYSPPKQLTWFSLAEGTKWPKGYFVTLILAEVDNGGFPAFVQTLVDWVKAKVTQMIASAIGSAIGASGGPITAIIGAAVGWVVGEVINLLIAIWKDDIFPAHTVSTVIPSFNARWNGKDNSPDGIVGFGGHGGHYQVRFDWRMFA